MKHLRFAARYVRYLLKARSRYFVHSPFVFDFINSVIRGRQAHERFSAIERIRTEMLRSEQTIHVIDLGAGNGGERLVRRIAGRSAKQRRTAELLYRLVDYFKPATALELGTSLGISGMYQALALQQGQFITVEGCPAIAEIARSNFNQLGLKNVVCITGGFDEVLPELLRQYPVIDYGFVDGNHTHEATMRYYNSLIPHLHEESVLVFDDIHWSASMEKAWQAICRDPETTVTIDLFYLGVVFFRKGLPKQHFILRK